MNRPNSIALVDISYIWKKTYHSMPGEPPIEAAKKTLRDLDRLRDGVEHLIICRDAAPYRRAEKFPAYKAQRPSIEPEERAGRKWLFEQLQARGYQMAWSDGYEADDVIATLAKAYGQWCSDVRIVTSDKDAAQCVTTRVIQYIPPVGEKDWEVRDLAGVEAKFGVTPEQMPLWQALQGDTSDNIPGIKGIGKGTATDLVQWFKTLPGIITALGAKDARIKPAVAQKLGAGLTDLNLYVELVTLDTAVPLDPEALLATLEPAPPQREATLDVELTGYMGNETPAPTTPETDAAYEQAKELYEERISPPPPRIGKDPNADEVLKRAAEQRAKLAEFERQTAAQNTNAPKTEERIDATQARIAEGNRAERERQVEDQYQRERVAEAEYDAVAAAPGDKAAGPAVVNAKVAPMPVATIKPGLAKTAPDKRAIDRSLEMAEVRQAVIDYGAVDERLQPLDLRSSEVLAKWFVAGGVYPQFKTPAQVFTVISRAKELGVGMNAALSCTHMVDGKPVNHADLIRALAERDPNCEYLMPVELTDTHAIWEGKHKRQSKPFQYTYTIEEARAAGLVKAGAYGKGGNWVSRPRDMLSKTAGSKLARLLWPGATLGLYCPEELSGHTMEELQQVAA